MIDKTTDGYHAEPDEVEALLRSLLGYHLAEADPLLRYVDLTQQQVLFNALVAAIRRERGRALSEIAATGMALPKVAELTRLGSRQRVQTLISAATRSAPEPASAKKPVSANEPVAVKEPVAAKEPVSA